MEHSNEATVQEWLVSPDDDDALQTARRAIVAGDFRAADQAVECAVRSAEIDPDDPHARALRALLLIRRGQPLRALQLLNDHGEDEAPELRVLCLYALDSPYWVGLAQELLESDDASVRRAMAQLLNVPDSSH